MASTPKPTDAELEVLRVLWRQGPATVRSIHAALAHRDTGYTTVLKTLQVMLAKGLVARDDAAKAHHYRAAVAQADTGRRLLSELLERVYDGSTRQLVLQALDLGAQDTAELEELRRLLAATADPKG